MLLFKSAMLVLIFTVKHMKASSIAYSQLSAGLACVKVHMELDPFSLFQADPLVYVFCNSYESSRDQDEYRSQT